MSEHKINKGTGSGEVAELKAKIETALAGGDAAHIEQLHSKGKLSARERIAALVDKDSFEEFDMLRLHGNTKPAIT